MVVPVSGLAETDHLGGVVDAAGPALGPAQRTQHLHTPPGTPEDCPGFAFACLSRTPPLPPGC